MEAAKGPTPRVGHTAVACGPAGSEKIYIFGGRNGIALGDGAPQLTNLVSGWKSQTRPGHLLRRPNVMHGLIVSTPANACSRQTHNLIDRLKMSCNRAVCLIMEGIGSRPCVQPHVLELDHAHDPVQPFEVCEYVRRLSGASAELLCFNTGRQEWQDVQIEGIGPDARSYHAMAASGDTLYVFGGCGEGKKGRLNDLHSYNCTSSTWTQLPTCNEIIVRLSILISLPLLPSCRLSSLQPCTESPRICVLCIDQSNNFLYHCY